MVEVERFAVAAMVWVRPEVEDLGDDPGPVVVVADPCWEVPARAEGGGELDAHVELRGVVWWLDAVRVRARVHAGRIANGSSTVRPGMSDPAVILNASPNFRSVVSHGLAARPRA